MPGGDELAAGDDRHAVAHELDLREQVRVQQHGHAALAQALEQRAHVAPAGRIQRARRLVEQQQPRVADQRLREPEALLHALRHRPDPPARHLGEADALEQVAPLGGAAVRAREPLVQLEQLVGRAPVREAEQLGEVAERALRPRRSPARRAADGRASPALGRTSPQAIFTSVDLPAPFGPSRPDELALADLEVDAAERGYRPVALVKAADGECGLALPSVKGDGCARRPSARPLAGSKP